MHGLEQGAHGDHFVAFLSSQAAEKIVKIAVNPCFQHPLEKNSCHSCLEEGGLIHEVTMREPVFNGRDFVENFNDEYKRFFKVLTGCLRFDEDEEEHEHEDDEEVTQEEIFMNLCLRAVHVEEEDEDEDEDEDDEGLTSAAALTAAAAAALTAAAAAELAAAAAALTAAAA